MADVNPTSYTELDFATLVQKLKDRVALKDSWKGMVNSTTAQALLESLAYATLNMVYNTQRSFEETTVDSAQFWESFVRMGNLVGYKVKRPTGAQATIVITPGGGDQTILKGTTIDINGFNFYFPADVFVASAGGDVTTTVIEGTLNNYQFTVSSPNPNQKYVFGSENTTDENIQVLVNSQEWTQADYVLLQEAGTWYELQTLPTKLLELFFGNSTTGLPLLGQVIDVNAYDVVGEDANYYGTDFTGDTTVDGLSFVVQTPITGGGGIETIENLRENVPLSYRTISGVVAKSDYKSYIENLPGIVKAKVLDVRDLKQVPFRVVRVYILPSGGYVSNQAFLDSIVSKLDPILPAGVKLEILNPLIRDVVVSLSVVVKRGFTGATVRTNVANAITDLYAVANLEFGEWVDTNTIQQTATAIKGVESVNVTRPEFNVSTMKDWEFLRLIQLEVF